MTCEVMPFIERAKDLVSSMSLEEKASLTSGLDSWFTKALDRLGVPSVRMSDGPHGLRTREEGGSELDILPAVCFPAGCAMAASFDRSLLRELGEELGRECQAYGVDVLLGPGVNIKRSPLCGRNFEYLSEDPLLAGELGAGYVEGIQSQGVGASVKHFLANNQEMRRMDSSSEMDERTMREIYMPAFERIVKRVNPWTVMAAYNKVDGVHCTQNGSLLNDLLCGEWGFGGLVISDWGATHDRVAAVRAGCALTMPGESLSDADIVAAVQGGNLDEAALDACCVKVVSLALRVERERHRAGRVRTFDFERGHVLSRRIASQSMVLLKNDDDLLPLVPGERDGMVDVAFIGRFAVLPRFQGGGSSCINTSNGRGALDAAREIGWHVSYADGYDLSTGETTDALLAEAEAVAAKTRVAVVFAGLPDAVESEGFDRSDMRMPEGHNRLIERVCAVQPNTVVVLHNGAPVEMPWIGLPKAVVETYLGGEAVGEATVDVLSGEVNPSGHLPETFPLRVEDNPSYLYYGGDDGQVTYNEGLFVGYRYYESKGQPVLFPFGHGLSYTEFTYGDLEVGSDSVGERDMLDVSVKVTNVGSRAGSAVVQLYVAPKGASVIRPVRELKEFAKVGLEPGQSETVRFALDRRVFAHFSSVTHDWRVEDGMYVVQIGRNAHDIILEHAVHVSAAQIPPRGGYTDDMTLARFIDVPEGKNFLERNLKQMMLGMARAGYMPKEFSENLEAQADLMPDVITMDMFSSMLSAGGIPEGVQSMGSAEAGLLGQSVSILREFLPVERIRDLDRLFARLNALE